MAFASTLPNRRQVLAGIGVAAATTALPLALHGRGQRDITYQVKRMALTTAKGVLETTRRKLGAISQLVLANENHVLILAGSTTGAGVRRLQL